MPKTRTAPTRSIREVREAHGLSNAEVRDRLRDLLPERYVPSESKLSRMETGTTAKLDPMLLVAIAQVLGVGIRELSPEAADELDTLKDLFEHASQCIAKQSKTLFSFAA